jgi:toxin ParE1/3/4
MSLDLRSDDPKLRFSHDAILDIKGTWAYLFERNEDAATRLITSIIEKCEMLSFNPLIGSSRDELIVGLRLFPFERYNIYYFPTEFGIEVYRVIHSSRDVIQIFKDAID